VKGSLEMLRILFDKPANKLLGPSEGLTKLAFIKFTGGKGLMDYTVVFIFYSSLIGMTCK
jgi:hypothetical protein